MAAKKKSKQKKPGRKSSIPPISKKLKEELITVGNLIEDNELWEALEYLEYLDSRHRNRPEIIEGLADVYQRLSDMENCQLAAERLTKLAPREPMYWLGLAQAAAFNERQIHAQRALHYFLKQWPDHPEVPQAKDLLAIIEETFIPDVTDKFGLERDQVIEIGYLHEQSRSFMARGENRKAKKVLEKLIELHPTFTAAQNNLSQVHWALGNLELATQTSEKVLSFEPDNLHALSNLVRFYLLLGNEEKAREYCDRMLASEDQATDPLLKKVEALSFLCEDEKVIEIYEQAQKNKEIGKTPQDAMVFHFAAVSYAMCGNTKQAKKLWEQAVNLAPRLYIAHDNLDDLGFPVCDRNGPYPFEMAYWLPYKIIDQFLKSVKGKSKKAIHQTATQLVDQFPGLLRLISMLLERGGPMGRDFGINLIHLSETPELMETYRQYAFGQDGPDSLRMEAANFLKSQGVIQDDYARLWLKGEWHEIQLLGFEISFEPSGNAPSPKVYKLYEKALNFLVENKGEEAEKILKQALEISPDDPSLLNNLAMSYQMQDRTEEALELTQSIHQRFPEYSFARLALARMAIDEKDYDQARDLINPVLSSPKLHITEFITLAGTEIEFALAKKDKKSAEMWLDMWESVDPDNDQLLFYRIKILGPKTQKRIEKFLYDDEE